MNHVQNYAFNKGDKIMQPSTKPKIVLHIDVNKTLIAEDKNNGKDLHLVVASAIAEQTVYEWQPGETTSYYDYLQAKIPGKSYDQAVKKRRLAHLNGFIRWIEGQPDHPKREEVLKTYNAAMKKMKKKLIFPSFFKLVEKLQQKKYDFTIVLRTFGDDSKQVTHEIEKRTSLKFRHWGAFRNGILTMKNGGSIGKVERIYQKIIKETGHFALKDNWKEWNSNKEKSDFGKRFIFDPRDPGTLSIFIDDNINADGTEKDIVAPIALGQGPVPVKKDCGKKCFHCRYDSSDYG